MITMKKKLLIAILITLSVWVSSCTPIMDIVHSVYDDPIVCSGTVTDVWFQDNFTWIELDGHTTYLVDDFQFVIIGNEISIKLTSEGYRIANY